MKFLVMTLIMSVNSIASSIDCIDEDLKINLKFSLEEEVVSGVLFDRSIEGQLFQKVEDGVEVYQGVFQDETQAPFELKLHYPDFRVVEFLSKDPADPFEWIINCTNN